MNKSELLFLLHRHHLQPQKSKGQHFLIEPRVTRKIIEAAQLTPETLVVEVGPGVGVLTGELCAATPQVMAVELDQRVLPILQKLRSVCPKLQVVSQDILKIDFQQLTQGRPYTLVGNLPYNIASAILKHMLESSHQPERLVVMVQKEVGERILAKSGDMSLLSLSIQLYGQPEYVTTVSRTAFFPQPQVTSMVLKVTNIHHPADVNPKTFFKLAHMGFNSKRKQLHNTLQGGLRLSKEATSRLLSEVKIEPSARPQELSVQDWKNLANAFDHFSESWYNKFKFWHSTQARPWH